MYDINWNAIKDFLLRCQRLTQLKPAIFGQLTVDTGKTC